MERHSLSSFSSFPLPHLAVLATIQCYGAQSVWAAQCRMCITPSSLEVFATDQESPVSQPTLSRPEEPFCPAWKVCCRHSSETNSISVSPFKEGARVIDMLCKGFQTLCWNPEWPLYFRSKCFHNLKRYCLYPKGE